MKDKKEQWIQWLRELQSIAQIGRTYCKDHYCQERYERLSELAAEIADGYTDQNLEMIQESSDELWSLPGGWAEVNTSPAESAVREVFEETGYIVEAKKLLAFYDKHKHDHPPQWPHAYKAFYLCELKGGEPTLSYESLAIDFFAEDQLPPLSLHRITEKQIHRMFEHVKHPDWPTDFD